MSDAFNKAMGFGKRADKFPVYKVTVQLENGSTKIFKTVAKNSYDAEVQAKHAFSNEYGAKIVKVEEVK